VTLSVIDFMKESASFMFLDRPDLYDDESEALDKIVTAMDAMRETAGSGLTTFDDYMLIRYQDDEVDEWDLVRKLSSVLSFHDEERVWVASHTAASQALKFDVDLPSPEDYEAEDDGDLTDDD
jgi:hypothetical protein